MKIVLYWQIKAPSRAASDHSRVLKKEICSNKGNENKLKNKQNINK